jgi:hydrogenase maturation protease
MVSTTPEYQSEKETPPRIVVIGVGNLLLKDEGIGIHVIQALQEMELPADIRLIDGGTSLELWAYTRIGDKLIIIDAAKAGGEPGAVYRFKPEDITAEKGILNSAHELGVIEALNLMTFAGNKPGDAVIIGIEPAEISPGLELSAVLRQKMPEIINVVLKEIPKPPVNP